MGLGRVELPTRGLGKEKPQAPYPFITRCTTFPFGDVRGRSLQRNLQRFSR